MMEILLQVSDTDPCEKDREKVNSTKLMREMLKIANSINMGKLTMVTFMIEVENLKCSNKVCELY